MAARRAEVVWSGDLPSGSGNIIRVGSQAFGDLPVTWRARTEEPDGKTSPEELLAAAHAVCYAMAFSNHLAQQGSPPDRLTVTATCHFERSGDGYAVTRMELDVRGEVAGMEAAAFEEAAQAGERACPISNAIRGNVDVQLSATLQGD
jgi:osmotically inducible protein OsmC